ncbi:hypothetical protein QAD02_010445 [Eretmocerus hayati]|uniref:Uncharacterized protein n=1 Tax=Eretmocerus hayati TaxID=131215 RepID=A0ACC2NWI6_9HYME|nr:hypothetical protein QAD02_010445 [Eretmocerus hayati]
MLPMLFRGVFLLAVVGWYSNSMWKMIDGYFKEQFQRFLNDEFDKNPRMRDDVLAFSDELAQPTEAPPISAGLEDALVEVLGPQSGPSESDSSASPSSSSADTTSFIGGGGEVAKVDENEVAAPLHDPPDAATTDSTDDDGDTTSSSSEAGPREPRFDTVKDEENIPALTVEIGEPPQLPESRESDQDAVKEKLRSPHRSPRKRKSSGLPQIGPMKSNEAGKRKKKQLQISLTSKGVPVAELPFKPAIDLYDLEKVSPEEYCPLSLDEDPTCEQTQPWPSSASAPRIF